MQINENQLAVKHFRQKLLVSSVLVQLMIVHKTYELDKFLILKRKNIQCPYALMHKLKCELPVFAII